MAISSGVAGQAVAAAPHQLRAPLDRSHGGLVRLPASLSQHFPWSLQSSPLWLRAPSSTACLQDSRCTPKLTAPSAAALWPAAAPLPETSTALMSSLQDHWRLACLRPMDAPWQPSNRRYNCQLMREAPWWPASLPDAASAEVLQHCCALRHILPAPADCTCELPRRHEQLPYFLLPTWDTHGESLVGPSTT